MRIFFFFSSRRRHTRLQGDWSSDVCSSDLLDLRTRFPHVHLLLAEIFARKNNYAMAILEIKTYLDLAPHAKDVDHVREQLAKLEKLNGSVSTSEKPDQM